MSPHRLSDYVESNSGSSTPVLIDELSDIDHAGHSSAPSESDFGTGSKVNEPIAIVGIGMLLDIY